MKINFFKLINKKMFYDFYYFCKAKKWQEPSTRQAKSSNTSLFLCLRVFDVNNYNS